MKAATVKEHIYIVEATNSFQVYHNENLIKEHYSFGKALETRAKYVESLGLAECPQNRDYYYKPTEFGITAADENSIFVWSSYGANSFCEIPETTDDMILVITNAKEPNIAIYDVKNLCKEDLRRVIDRHCAFLSNGCSYRYKLVNRVGNCYFVN